jgi:hypothetical protein
MHPGGAGAAAAAAETVAAADTEELATHATPLKSATRVQPECNHPGAQLGPISSHTFRTLNQTRTRPRATLTPPSDRSLNSLSRRRQLARLQRATRYRRGRRHRRVGAGLRHTSQRRAPR